MDHAKKLAGIEDFIRGEHYAAAGREMGAILDSVLRDFYGRVRASAPGPVLEELQDAEKVQEKSGKHPYPHFTLGQWVGLYRQAEILKKAKSVLKIEVKHAFDVNLNRLNEIRNNCTHEGHVPTLDELDIFLRNLKTIMKELGYLEGYTGSGPAPPRIPAGTRPGSDTIRLGPSNATGISGSDILLQIIVWSIVLVILGTAVWVIVHFDASRTALVATLGPILFLAVGAYWFYHPRKRKSSAPPRTILEDVGRRVTFEISGKNSWTYTGVLLREAHSYEFNTTGEVQHSMFSGWHNADGNPDPMSPRSKIAPDFDVASLIGRLDDDGEPFLIGVHLDMTPEHDGKLYVAVNDWPLFDNKGSFRLTVQCVATGTTAAKQAPQEP